MTACHSRVVQQGARTGVLGCVETCGEPLTARSIFFPLPLGMASASACMPPARLRPLLEVVGSWRGTAQAPWLPAVYKSPESRIGPASLRHRQRRYVKPALPASSPSDPVWAQSGTVASLPRCITHQSRR
ncbi:hypothetical protein BT67DRAFT_295038 [Trichocladium antarcticum]|uniref:Uncharacterized protein n=1 Tax=Trichocladium antarcticum TaxID=1450529 RepID=A0AAN6UKP0_9PEZI|nr:hypothetical protein BT67DRAFT_295038 [Trichocladium antarcticum]